MFVERKVMFPLCYKPKILFSCLPIKFSENCMKRNILFLLCIWSWLVIKVFHWYTISWHYYGCTICLLMMLTAMNVQLFPWQKEKRYRTSYLDCFLILDLTLRNIISSPAPEDSYAFSSSFSQLFYSPGSS